MRSGGAAPLALLGLSLAATSARAACVVAPGGTIACDHNTTTRDTSDKDDRQPNSNSRTEHFDDGHPIAATVGPGVSIHGDGLALVESKPHGAPQAISLTNRGAIFSHVSGRTGTVALAGDGAPVTYRGRGSVSNTVGTGIVVQNKGDIAIKADGAISGGATTKVNRNGNVPTPPAIEATEIGKGNIVVGGSGSVVGPGGRGIIAKLSGSGNGNILVTGTGDTAGRGQICPGVNPASVLRTGATGCSGIRALISGTGTAGNVKVDRSGNVSGTSAAINAITFGTGNVAVATAAAAQITGVSEFGIEASAKGPRSTGRVAVVTGAQGTLTSGGTGILATNLAQAISAAAGSRILVDAAGRIVSGSFALANLNKKNPEGIVAGISAGYLGGVQPEPNAAVHGATIVHNAATIDALSGDGIFGYNFGSGPLAIRTRSAVDSQQGDGIVAQAAKGPTTVGLAGPDAVVTGTGRGRAGLATKETGGSVDLKVGRGAVLRGADGADGAVMNDAGARQAIKNLGTIAGNVGIVGSRLTIINRGSIVSDAGTSPQPAGMERPGRGYAVVFTGGRNSVGGPGTIGGIDVTGTSIFEAAARGSRDRTPLLVNGALRFAPTATYRVLLSSGGAAAIDVGGTARLGGTLDLDPRGAPPKPGSHMRLVDAANGIEGRFSGVTDGLAFFTPSLIYRADSVTLGAHYDYRLPGGTSNETSVGGALDAAAAVGSSAAILRGLREVAAGQGAAVIDSLSGEGITAAQSAGLRSSQLFTSTIFDQTTFYGASANSVTLAPAPASPARGPTRADELADAQPSAAGVPAAWRTWRVWSTGFGGGDTAHGEPLAGTADTQSAIYGGSLGVDYQLTPGDLLGLAVGGSDAAFSVPARATTGSTAGGHIALYDLASFGPFYGASSAAFSYFSNQTTRMIASFSDIAGETERGAFGSEQFRARLEVGRHLETSGYEVTPFAALEAAVLRSNGFAETPISGPGVLGLDVAGQTTASVPTFVGMRLEREMSLGGGVVLIPTLQASYIHEFAPYRQDMARFAVLPQSAFLVEGARAGRDAAQVKVGGELMLGRHVAIFANFDSELSGKGTLFAGKGGVRYVW